MIPPAPAPANAPAPAPANANANAPAPAPAPAPIAPPARIRRNTAWQRAYLPRAIDTIAALDAFTRIRDEHDARARLAARLDPLRASLLASPFWSDLLRAHALSPSDLRTLDDLAEFPTIDRETLRDRWRDVPASAPDDSIVVFSSGTTGDPVPVLKDGWDSLVMWAVLRFFVAHFGVTLPPKPRVVLLCSLPGGLEYSVRLPLIGGGALHRISLARPRPLERLRRVAPSVIFSDPAGLHWLADQADDRLAPRLVLSSAQYLAPDLRARLAAPVVNYYATTETGPIAWECKLGSRKFHFLVPEIWPESIATTDGTEIVVTRLRPSALPLLRYRTGDAGRVFRDSCRCGVHGWSMTGFSGRHACDFVTPDGRRVDAWRLAWLFKHVPLRSFRLTQLAPSRFDLRIAGSPADLSALLPRLTAALQTLGWPDPHVDADTIEQPLAPAKPKPFNCLI